MASDTDLLELCYMLMLCLNIINIAIAELHCGNEIMELVCHQGIGHVFIPNHHNLVLVDFFLIIQF